MPKNKTVKRARIQSTATEDAFGVCEILVEAYRLGQANGGSMDWNQVDFAHQEAKRALRKKRKELGALSAPRIWIDSTKPRPQFAGSEGVLQLADSKGVLRPCRIIMP